MVLHLNQKSVKFEAGGNKRHVIHEHHAESDSHKIGMIMVNGLIRFADDSESYCLLKISEIDSGELMSVGVFLLKGGIVFSRHPKFLSFIGKTREHAFPFRYKYTAPINC